MVSLTAVRTLSVFCRKRSIQWSGFSSSTMAALEMLAHLNEYRYYSSLEAPLAQPPHGQKLYWIAAINFCRGNCSAISLQISKRLIKSLKFTSLIQELLLPCLIWRTFLQSQGHPSLGSLWESVVLGKFKGHFPFFEISFYRTNHGAEVDFLVTNGKKL